MTLLHDAGYARKPRSGRTAPPARGLPRECARRACSLKAWREPSGAADRAASARSAAAPVMALVVMAAVIAGTVFWMSVVRPIEAAADALGTAVEIVTPAGTATPRARLDRAEREFGAAQRAASQTPDADVRAEAARRLTEMEAARDAVGR